MQYINACGYDSQHMKLLLVFNPRAGAGRAARLLAPIQQSLGSFAEVELLQTGRAGEARERVAVTDLADYDGVLSAGGDGTLFEVVNGLFVHDGDKRVPLGVIPVGTGNAFARDLDLMPGDWQGALEIVRAAHTREVDVGAVENSLGDSFYFLNIVGCGLPVDAMHIARRLKFIGNSAYTAGTLWQAMRLRSYAFEVEADGRRIDQDSLFIEVSNTRYTGTTFLIAPDAKLDDGLLDVTLVSRMKRTRLLRLFPTIYQGKHVGFPEVTTLQAREIRLKMPAKMPLAPDGEIHGETPVIIRCLPRALDVFFTKKGSE